MSTDKLQNSSREELLQKLSLVCHHSSNATVLYHQAAAEKFGLNATDMKTLPLLEGGPITAGKIAESLGLTTGAVTSVIDRLEKAGIVRRRTDPNDRRKVVVDLIPEAIQDAGKIYSPMGNAMMNLFQNYKEEELKLLIRFQEEATKILIQEATHLRNSSQSKKE
ncbi:MarR family winged helix-turn-helix transcriptional regulator [Leptospira stimsonii]|uniref:MarR family transcriptional regulator n=1 Tax=Leptospira stimsonii TaxID=2202203 RepID=A0A4R9L8U7_9LEPT|nr:MarR family transcriptional regulator [Leptospira stimsonii]RHX84212.1 MarR family transcriptional regulator [Leptospira stimsonii]TGK26057.1 MarR family transcriptional regulator [Leptospira stimsonii]TGM22490.1 MarR family transcriptional regulator [Leptospira stimsonii]